MQCDESMPWAVSTDNNLYVPVFLNQLYMYVQCLLFIRVYKKTESNSVLQCDSKFNWMWQRSSIDWTSMMYSWQIGIAWNKIDAEQCGKYFTSQKLESHGEEYPKSYTECMNARMTFSNFAVINIHSLVKI